MVIPPADLTIHVNAGPVADDEELQRLSRRLRSELLEMDLEYVDPIRQGSAPAGAKGDPLTLGALAISLGPVALKALLDMLQSWLKRHQEASVSLKMGGDEITITGTPSETQQQLIETWISRHKV